MITLCNNADFNMLANVLLVTNQYNYSLSKRRLYYCYINCRITCIVSRYLHSVTMRRCVTEWIRYCIIGACKILDSNTFCTIGQAICTILYNALAVNEL